jgi:hypothetical protein
VVGDYAPFFIELFDTESYVFGAASSTFAGNFSNTLSRRRLFAGIFLVFGYGVRDGLTR